MPQFNLRTLFLLLCFVVATIAKTANKNSKGHDLTHSRNNTRSRLHAVPDESKAKRPKKVHNREGGSRFLAREKKDKKSRRKKLDRSSFLGLMGDDFKEPWMAYSEPKKPIISIPPDEIRNLTAIKGSWATTELEYELARLNLTADLLQHAPELAPLEASIRNYFVRRTKCPVEFTWKDLGKRYWPRWVRHGECVNRDGFCSFPPGMICVPGVSTVVHLLHWECSKKADRASRSTNYEESYFLEYKRPAPPKLNRKGKPRRTDVLNPPRMETSVLYKKRVPPIPTAIHLPRKTRKCEWKKVPYLITIDCFCAC